MAELAKFYFIHCFCFVSWNVCASSEVKSTIAKQKLRVLKFRIGMAHLTLFT